MRKLTCVTWMLAAAACSSDDPPPSCQQAIGHYYAAGCMYSDLTTSPPSPYSEGQFEALCQQQAAQISSKCNDEFDAWLTCNNEVVTPAKSNADCDCSTEFMALLRCG